jgi:hypothetical protein
VLTNDPGIDISAAPPELGSGKLHSHTTPTLPGSSDLADRSGPDRDLVRSRLPARAMGASIWHVPTAPLTTLRSIRMDPIDPNDVHAEANTLLRTMKLVRILQKKAGGADFEKILRNRC